tara:strand:+ start:1451 stop:2746 length:1296 start_codon:yes stop_codon:yes gene_type:complete
MSNFWQKKVAQESAETAGHDDNISNIESPEENLETQLTELASEDAQLDTLMRDGETLNADMAKTEDAIDTAADAMDEGEELSETQAESLEIGQESIRKRWGITNARVARESFRNGRGATRIAHESWKDNLKDLWKRLLAFIEQMINKAKDLKLKVMNVGKSAVSRAKKYEDAIGNMGSKKKKDTISGSWMGKLAIEGNVDVTKSADIAVDMVSGGKASSAVEAFASQLSAVAAYSVADNDGELKFSADGAAKEFSGEAAKKLKVLPGFEAEGDGEINPHRVYALPGGNYFQSAVKYISGEGDQKLALMQASFFSSGEKVEDNDIPTPSSGDLRKANSQLKKIGENYEKVLKDFRKQDEGITKLKDAIKKTVDNFDKSKDEDRTHLRNARQVANGTLVSAQNANKAIHTTVRGVLSGLTGYIGAGIGAYEKA